MGIFMDLLRQNFCTAFLSLATKEKNYCEICPELSLINPEVSRKNKSYGISVRVRASFFCLLIAFLS